MEKFITLRVPQRVKNKLDRNHFEKKGWTDVYWYVKRQRTKFNKKIVFNDVVSGDCYQHNTFYKDSAFSKKSDMWDYYKILKPKFKEPIIAKPRQKIRKNDVRLKEEADVIPIKDEYGFQKIDGKVIISFD